MKRNFSAENGSATLIGMALVFTGMTGLYLTQSGMRVDQKVREMRKSMAVEAAKQSNLAALSYLHAALENAPSKPALLQIVDDKIVGSSDPRIQPQSDGTAIFHHSNASLLNSKQIEDIFTGVQRIHNLPQSSQTVLRIVETQPQNGKLMRVIVDGTTRARYGKESFGLISTVGKITAQQIIGDEENEFEDCNTCIAAASALTLQLGFVANPAITRNFGFYKVSPAANLCDIHFLRHSGVRIQNHAGKTTLLNDQVAIYCPCNCPFWAN